MTSSPREPVGAEAMAAALAATTDWFNEDEGRRRDARALDNVDLGSLVKAVARALTAFRASARDDASLGESPHAVDCTFLKTGSFAEWCGRCCQLKRSGLGTTETEREAAYFKVVEDHIRSLKWSDDTPEDTRTLVAGNLRGFWASGRALASSPAARPAEDALTTPPQGDGAKGEPLSLGALGLTEEDVIAYANRPVTKPASASPHGDAARPASEDEFTKAALAYCAAAKTWYESNEDSESRGPIYMAYYEAEKRMDAAYAALRSAAATTKEGGAP